MRPRQSGGWFCRQQASAALAVLLVVSCIVIVVVGGCVAYKVDRKVKEWQERQATNDDMSLRPELPLPGEQSNAPAGARALWLLTTAYTVPVLQISTNLVDWQDAPDGWTNNLPALFFRYRP